MSNEVVPPPTVKRATICIWASFATTVCSWVLVLFMPPPPHAIATAQKLGLSVHTFATLKLVALIIPALIIYFVLSKVVKGENWARILCLIYGAIALPESVYRFLSENDTTTRIISAGMNTLYIGFGYYALYLLFISPGKNWFRKKQSAVSN